MEFSPPSRSGAGEPRLRGCTASGTWRSESRGQGRGAQGTRPGSGARDSRREARARVSAPAGPPGPPRPAPRRRPCRSEVGGGHRPRRAAPLPSARSAPEAAPAPGPLPWGTGPRCKPVAGSRVGQARPRSAPCRRPARAAARPRPQAERGGPPPPPRPTARGRMSRSGRGGTGRRMLGSPRCSARRAEAPKPPLCSRGSPRLSGAGSPPQRSGLPSALGSRSPTPPAPFLWLRGPFAARSLRTVTTWAWLRARGPGRSARPFPSARLRAVRTCAHVPLLTQRLRSPQPPQTSPQIFTSW